MVTLQTDIAVIGAGAAGADADHSSTTEEQANAETFKRWLLPRISGF